MFSLFNKLKKEIDLNIYSPIEGKCIDISDTKDEVFSQKMMGDGVAVIPKGNVVYAPCDGELTMIFPTKHAFGITMSNGVEILIHIGVDTVDLNGKGFKSFMVKGDKVKHGEKIVEFDEAYLSKEDLDMTVMTIIANNNSCKFSKIKLNKEVSKMDKVLILEKTE